MKRKRKLLPVLPVVLLSLILPGFISSLKTVRYEVAAEGLPQPVRIALVTDLHACAYGRGQRKLLDAVEEQAPDLLLLGGDIFDDKLPEEKAGRAGLSGRLRGLHLCTAGPLQRHAGYGVSGAREVRQFQHDRKGGVSDDHF